MPTRKATFGAAGWVNIDGMAQFVLSDRPCLLPKWYFMLSYAYYKHDVSPVPDHRYDEICRRLLERFDEIDDRLNLKRFVDTQALAAGTGYHLDFDRLPPDVVSGAEALIRLSQQGF
ncbi:MAG: hypothetical protein GY906_23100 [bacterium]|nr:hypothetical protein [bacterium]